MAATTSRLADRARNRRRGPGSRLMPEACFASLRLALTPAAPAMTCSLVTPAGSCLLTAPEKIRLVARARIFGAAMRQATLTTAREDDDADLAPLGTQPAHEPLERRLEVLGFLAGADEAGRAEAGPLLLPAARAPRRRAERRAARAGGWPAPSPSRAGLRAPSVRGRRAARSCHFLRGQLRVHDLR